MIHSDDGLVYATWSTYVRTKHENNFLENEKILEINEIPTPLGRGVFIEIMFNIVVKLRNKMG